MCPCLGDPIVLQGHTVRIALKLTNLGGKMINPICLSLFVQAAVTRLVFQPMVWALYAHNCAETHLNQPPLFASSGSCHSLGYSNFGLGASVYATQSFSKATVTTLLKLTDLTWWQKKPSSLCLSLLIPAVICLVF